MLRPRPRKVRLPNGVEILANRREEALLVWGEVGSYLRHGATLRPGDVIVDVGANLGLFSLWAWEQTGRDADIYAFEPVPAIHALLAHNLGQLGDPRVRAFGCGLSRQAGEAVFSYHPNAPFASTAFPEDADLALTETLLARSLDTLPAPLPLIRHLPGPLRALVVRLISRIIQQREPVRCELRTLSQVIREQGIQRIDFLKIDAEKAEMDVLEGLDEAHWPLVRQAFVEVHDRGGRLAAMRALFERRGFQTVVTEQEAFFAGTEIWALTALRARRDG